MSKGNRDTKSLNKNNSSGNHIAFYNKQSWSEYFYSSLGYGDNEISSDPGLKQKLIQGKKLLEDAKQSKKALNRENNPKLVSEEANPKKQNIANAVAGFLLGVLFTVSNIANSDSRIIDSDQDIVVNYKNTAETVLSTSYNTVGELLKNNILFEPFRGAKGELITYRQDGLNEDLFAAIHARSPEGVIAALRNGADVNAKNYFGDTPLRYAAGINDHKIIDILLQNGAK